ncbi:MAG: NUDIX hydrolase [Bacilli bacterium]|nr:NUDIX hydrolase [Bacilli bacterium]
MKNFAVNVNGKEYWISRSIATCGFVFKKVKDTIYCLVEKRGQGAADFQDHWCAPCGYLDYDESLRECIKREIKEECGFICDILKLKMVAVNSDPKENRQNVTAHFVYDASENEDFYLNLRNGGEKDEVETVQWMPVAFINKQNGVEYNETVFNDKWAFNHDALIKKYIQHYGKEKIFGKDIV